MKLRPRATEDRVSANATPDDVRLPGLDLVAVLEGGAAVVSPSHLPDAGMTLNALDAETRMKALFVFCEIGDEPGHRIPKLPLLLRT